ncbi:MAG: domain S-box protein [Actinomycetia bacterium]|nr:domain S-box protein [Actinomycetes bacterium]
MALDARQTSTQAGSPHAFDRFSAPAAVLDPAGVIVETNEAWRLFAVLNGGAPGTTGPGTSYLDVCQRAARAGSVDGHAVADGLWGILLGKHASFELEYPCPSPVEDRWFRLQASTTPIDDGAGLVVFHVDVTVPKLEHLHGSTKPGGFPTGPVDAPMLQQHIDQCLERVAAFGGDLTVIALRLGGLDVVGAELGRQAAAQVLHQVNARVQRVLRAGDLQCSLPGGDLIILVPDLAGEAAHAVAGRLGQAMAVPFQSGGTQVALSASVGFATSARDAVEELPALARSRARLDEGRRRVITRHAVVATAQRDAVVANSNDVVLYFEPDGAIAWASPGTERIGFDPSGLVGRNGLDMVHPDDRKRVAATFARIVEPGAHVRLEFRVVGDDGSVRWIDETVTNLVDDPDLGYMVGNVQDITARRRDEDALRLRSWLLDAAGQAIVAVDMDGNVIYWNDGAAEIYGWTVDEAVGRPMSELLVPAPGWVAEARSVKARVEAGGTWSGDFSICAKDGREVAISVTDSAVFDDAGTQIGVVALSSDISERMRLESARAHLSAIVATSTDAIVSTDLEGNATSWNHAAELLYGYTAEEMIGRNIEITVPPAQRGSLRSAFATIRAGRARTVQAPRLRADGSEVEVSVSISPITDAAGVITGVSAIVRDVTAQMELNRKVEEDRRRLAEAQRSAQLGSFELDFAAGTAAWSEELRSILGVGVDTAPSREAFRERVHPDDRALLGDEFAKAIAGSGDVECTCRIVRPDGEERWVVARVSGVMKGLSRMSGTVLDVTDRKRLELNLWKQATHDALTGLPNRTLLLQRLEAVLSTGETGEAGEAGEAGVGVLLFDVDRFKVVNDSLGHDRGDRMLIAIADAVRSTLGPEDTAARFGSDTFVVVVPHLTAPERLLALATRLRSRLAAGLAIDEDRFTPSISVGLVVASPGDSGAAVLRDADTAMYRAKERGRDRAEWFDPSLRTAVVASYELERDLRDALDRDELHMVFQPVLDLATGSFGSCEALVRWRHPVRGEINPVEFIPVAESTGLIVPLGAWVLRQSLAVASGWPDEVAVAVNIAARQLAEPDLVDLVRGALAESGVSASRLVLEVTETAVLQDRTAAARTIAALRATGVRVVIDDFGTGYTSLSFLRDYPLDGIKIDRSFVTDLEHGSTAIVDAIIRMAEALGLRVIAEGVETRGQLEMLRSLGCRYIQGYLVSQPLCAADLHRGRGMSGTFPGAPTLAPDDRPR